MNSRIYILISLVLINFVFYSCSDDLVTPTGIVLNRTSTTIKPQESETLTVSFLPENITDKSLTWKSADETIATVDNGKITAIKEGVTMVTVTSVMNPKIFATCEVIVSWTQINANGEVFGVWERNSTVHVTGHISIPKGKSLIIEDGVKVIFDDKGIGLSQTKIEFILHGNLYCKGTKENPVLFTISQEKRVVDNTFKGLWGGIVATADCEELLLDNTIIEYSGGNVLDDSPTALAGIYKANTDTEAQLTLLNPNGKYVIVNSIFRNSGNDGIYAKGGNVIIQHNIFYANGYLKGNAINVHSNSKADVAFNLIYSPNENGLKCGIDTSKLENSALIAASVKAYNNTIINSGWRHDSINGGINGGSFYIQKKALVSVFNNLMVNGKYKAMTPGWGTESACDSTSVIDYNFYSSGSQSSTLSQDIKSGIVTAYLGYTKINTNIYPTKTDVHSIVSSSAGDIQTDPRFINYPFNDNSLINFTFSFGWNLYVQSISPILINAYNGSELFLLPHFGDNGLTINNILYVTDTPKPIFGAYGIN